VNKKNILSFALGPIFSVIFGLLIVPMMAWAFSPDDIGRLSFLQIVLSFSLLFLVLGLDQAYVREFHGAKDKPSLFKASFIPGFILLIIIGVITLFFGNEISILMFGVSNWWLYFLTLICVFSNYISRFLSLILRMQERGLAYSMSQILPKLLQILMLIFLIFTGIERSFLNLLWITMLSTLAVLVVYGWNTREEWQSAYKASTSPAQTKGLLVYGLPLVFSGLAYWGLSATSILVMRVHSTYSELGVYAVTSSIAGAAAIFQSIFTLVWAPTVYKWVEQGVDMARVDDIGQRALAIVSAIFIFIGMLSWMVDYFLPDHYISVKNFLLCAILPGMLYTLSEITCVGIGITRRTTLTVWLTLVALLFNVLLSSLLVPKYGAAGAFAANTIAFYIFFILRTEISANIWRSFPRGKLYFVTFLLCMSAILKANFTDDFIEIDYYFWIFSLIIYITVFYRQIIEIGPLIKNYFPSFKSK
jgi:O-antigen/teichoic acid export membrane protein